MDDLRAFYTAWQLDIEFNVTNTIFMDTGGVLTLGISAHELGTDNAYSSTLDYCNYAATLDVSEETISNSQTINPLLTNPSIGDFSLITGSPCFNAGNGIAGANNIGWINLRTQESQPRPQHPLQLIHKLRLPQKLRIFQHTTKFPL